MVAPDQAHSRVGLLVGAPVGAAVGPAGHHRPPAVTTELSPSYAAEHEALRRGHAVGPHAQPGMPHADAVPLS